MFDAYNDRQIKFHGQKGVTGDTIQALLSTIRGVNHAKPNF